MTNPISSPGPIRGPHKELKGGKNYLRKAGYVIFVKNFLGSLPSLK